MIVSPLSREAFRFRPVGAGSRGECAVRAVRVPRSVVRRLRHTHARLPRRQPRAWLRLDPADPCRLPHRPAHRRGSPDVALALFDALTASHEGELVRLSCTELNRSGADLARSRGLPEPDPRSGCIPIVHGPPLWCAASLPRHRHTADYRWCGGASGGERFAILCDTYWPGWAVWRTLARIAEAWLVEGAGLHGSEGLRWRLMTCLGRS